MSNVIGMPLNFGEVIREKVRGTILDAIPPEQIDKMIAAELATIMQDEPASYDYGRNIPAKPGLVRKIILEEMEAYLRPQVKALVETSVAVSWENGTQRVSGELVEKLKPVVLDSLLGLLAGNVAGALRQRS